MTDFRFGSSARKSARKQAAAPTADSPVFRSIATATDDSNQPRERGEIPHDPTGEAQEDLVTSLPVDNAALGEDGFTHQGRGEEQNLLSAVDRSWNVVAPREPCEAGDGPNFALDLTPLPAGVADSGERTTHAALTVLRTTTGAAPSDAAQLRPPRVSVVIPTFNEAKNLPHVMSRIPADTYEVIVVDGNSVDGTVDVALALRPGVRIVLQNRSGKGNAMACGFAAVTGDVVVMLDADGSADPQEIPRFVEALVAGADYAKGTRFAEGGGSTDITPLRAWGNRWLNRIANVLFGTRYTDLCYGYNAFWRHCLDCLALDPRTAREGKGKLWGDGFEIETIINTRVAKAGLRIAEVPSYEHSRIHGQSNLNTWRDGVRVLRALVVERFNGVGRPLPNHVSPFPGLGPVPVRVGTQDREETAATA